MLLLGVFSPIVNAEEVSQDYKFHWTAYASSNTSIGTMVYTSSGLGDFFGPDSMIYANVQDDYHIIMDLMISSASNSVLVKENQNFKFDLSKVICLLWWKDRNGLETYMQKFDSINVTLIYNDDTTESITNLADFSFKYLSGSTSHSFYMNDYLTANKDIRTILIQYKYSPKIRVGISGYEHFKLGYNHSGSNFALEVQSEEAGFLDSILGWVKNIGEKVSDTFDTISSGFANIGTWFAELPGKLWEVISDGLKGLFVPDDEYMASYSDKWDSLLADRFGAIYQVCDIVANSWDGIMAVETDTVLDFPEVTIPIGGGESFTFGGYKVRVMPAVFRTQIRPFVVTITSIICTIAFINGLLKRYDEIFGGKS